MAGVIPRYERGPVTREVAETVIGGQLVEARAAGKIGKAAANSKVVLGVATKDATPRATNQNTVDPITGLTMVNLTNITEHVAVGRGAFYPVTFAAAAAFGQKLKAAANGQVTPFVSGTDTEDMIVGRCEEALGVSSGAVGLAFIY